MNHRHGVSFEETHWVSSIGFADRSLRLHDPTSLRRLFPRERRLLGILTRCAYETVRRCFGVLLGEEGGRPGMVAAIQSFGSKLQWNLHVHPLVTDGLLFPGLRRPPRLCRGSRLRWSL